MTKQQKENLQVLLVLGVLLPMSAGLLVFGASKLGWMRGLPPQNALKGALYCYGLFVIAFGFMFTVIRFAVSPTGTKVERIAEKILGPIILYVINAIVLYLLIRFFRR